MMDARLARQEIGLPPCHRGISGQAASVLRLSTMIVHSWRRLRGDVPLQTAALLRQFGMPALLGLLYSKGTQDSRLGLCVCLPHPRHVASLPLRRSVRA